MIDSSTSNLDECHQRAHWPTIPRWHSDYPGPAILEVLETTIEQYAIGTAFYRGLADPRIIELLSRRRPEIDFSVMDYFDYWRIEEKHWDDSKLGDQYWKAFSDSYPEWLRKVKFQLGEDGGGVWKSCDLVIQDFHTDYETPAVHGTSIPLPPFVRPRVAVLLGPVVELRNQDEYAWTRTADARVGIRRAQAEKA